MLRSTAIQKLLKPATLLVVLLFSAWTARAEEPVSALEGTFFQSAKIYVVLAVVVVILLGIAVYLYRMDRKISKLEKEMKES